MPAPAVPAANAHRRRPVGHPAAAARGGRLGRRRLRGPVHRPLQRRQLAAAPGRGSGGAAAAAALAAAAAGLGSPTSSPHQLPTDGSLPPSDGLGLQSATTLSTVQSTASSTVGEFQPSLSSPPPHPPQQQGATGGELSSADAAGQLSDSDDLKRKGESISSEWGERPAELSIHGGPAREALADNRDPGSPVEGATPNAYSPKRSRSGRPTTFSTASLLSNA